MKQHQPRYMSAEAVLAARRQFLAGLSAAAATAWIGVGRAACGAETPGAGTVPMIRLGKYSLSRMIAGSNPLLGYSYQGPHTDRAMKEYFTTERSVEFLLQCEREGINCHQFSTVDQRVDSLRMLRERGSKMHFICLHSQREKIKTAIELTAPIAMSHHGGATDKLFADGKSQRVHDYIKAVHDAGLLAGMSAHNPENIQRAADEGWEVDFFMTCFYFLTRKSAHVACETPTLDVGPYSFFKDDPLKMTEVIRQVKQPCLAFKILGAGRKCASEATVREAFQFAFSRIKPGDGVIVGMFPRYFDEVHANAQYTRELGRPAS